MAEEIRVLSHLARVRLVNDQRKVQLVEKLGLRDVAGVDGEDLYLWDAEISNDLLDSHFTHMSESTLKNYAEDAERGVAFLKGHNWHDLPIGYSVSGELVAEGGRKSVLSGFYTVRSIPEAADLIKRMEAKILRDVSVGFHGGQEICDLCGQEFWDCRHFPGLKYEEKKGDTVVTQLATFTIEDANLSEVSGVFDGSTPEAMIRKAQVAAQRGDLTLQQVQTLEQRYRTRLPVTRSFATAQPQKGEKMEGLKRIVNVLVEQKIIKEDQRETVDDNNVADHVEALALKVAKLEPRAAEGDQYRSDLIEDALSEGVRAQGNDFKRELYESTLKSAPLPVVKQMRDDWKKTANAALPAGRSSVDDVSGSSVKKTEDIPDEAYA